MSFAKSMTIPRAGTGAGMSVELERLFRIPLTCALSESALPERSCYLRAHYSEKVASSTYFAGWNSSKHNADKGWEHHSGP